MQLFRMDAMKYSASPLYFLGLTPIVKASMHTKTMYVISEIFHGIAQESVALHNRFKLSHRKYSDQHNQWNVRAAHDG